MLSESLNRITIILLDLRVIYHVSGILMSLSVLPIEFKSLKILQTILKILKLGMKNEYKVNSQGKMKFYRKYIVANKCFGLSQLKLLE